MTKKFNQISKISALVFFIFLSNLSLVQNPKGNDVTAPLHALQPNYTVPYGKPNIQEVKSLLDRIYNYLDSVTPAQLIDRRSGKVITAMASIDTNVILKQGDYRLTSYEWGVTYSAMLRVGELTGDAKFTNYTTNRLNFISNVIPSFRILFEKYPHSPNALRQPINPLALDDAGAMCAAFIKTLRATNKSNLRPIVDNYINYISSKQYRLSDGTLARNRPIKNTLWLDDLYMSVPALAQMGKLTGNKKYYDDAVKQVLQFSQRMFNKEIGLYMHGWVQEMPVHPEFHWARANGWALMAMTELLDVLPEDHAGRKAVMKQFNAQIKGLASYQSGQGFWHQLLDKNDSYLETSATAIYAYCIAHAINKKWINAKAHAPMCILAWNAISTKVNDKGQVEGTCVGTGMAFDPAFYYYRPTNLFAAHSYGPVLLAGAEIIVLLKNYEFGILDSSLQLIKPVND
jgi:unsaturated rhamnogalacturonyl hydrolase